ncbi:SpoIVB peptidase [Intestinimonas massiliensis]|uniref:SpoIVB peptidase n=1 Tax=Intestinimonas massiliensis (ex Afouda et al. 2020) TaxID=1673721 RepID=A0ABS9MCZ0_9FIRM|nr:SpoIVB peptidase [Intestinimonas massiliensis (ex Afouda et al. 2020)]MCG4528684.1 SpoIVB peptidase [Intestinimonas massiliensis (ex Afouda et al. 2020)]MCQ4806931.1 SpoIVB peptidase [Intestinimonas massiliensis (ex Afouda et al. 2020)]
MNEEQHFMPWAGELLQAVRAAAVCLLAGLLVLSVTGRARAAGPGGEEARTTAAFGTGERMVVPLGRAVGIKMFSDGVLVVGLSEITGEAGSCAPAKDCGLRQGDIITHINDTQVDTIEQVQSVLQGLEGDRMSIRAIRGDKQMQLTAQAVKCSADGAYKLGAWIRDSMAGIGTLTFYDPETGAFGALGHGINDVDTALLMPLESGSIMYATVADVKKGESGSPGELHGAFQVDRDMGELYANTGSGVFGTLTDDSLTDGLRPVPVAARREVKLGGATILSNIAGDTVEEYAVEITKVYPGSGGDTRELMVKVTDPRLLEATGGIVQGMSGSPILQNGKLVGAVTHVLVNNPTEGYGILAETMLAQTPQTLEAKVS